MKKLLLAFSLLLFTAALHADTLWWDRSPETNVVKYHVYHGFKGGLTQKTTVTNNFMPLTLIPGSNYWFFVTAATEDNIESPPSEQLDYFKPYPVPYPIEPKVTHFRLVDIGSDTWQLEIKWQALPAEYKITNYVVQVFYGSQVYTNHQTIYANASFKVPSSDEIKVYLRAVNSRGASSAEPLKIPAQPSSLKIISSQSSTQ